MRTFPVVFPYYWTGIACLKLSFSSRISGGTPTIDCKRRFRKYHECKIGRLQHLAVCQEMPQLITLGKACNFQNTSHPFLQCLPAPIKWKVRKTLRRSTVSTSNAHLFTNSSSKLKNNFFPGSFGTVIDQNFDLNTCKA